jgi:hypothetical protein
LTGYGNSPGEADRFRCYEQEIAIGAAAALLAFSSRVRFRRKICTDIRALNPRDMIDPQSFLWVQGWEEYPNEDEAMHSALIRLVFCILMRTKKLRTKCVAISLSSFAPQKTLENS